MIPEGWIIQKSSEYCSTIADGTHETPKQVQNNGLSLYTSKNLRNNNTFDKENCYHISKDDIYAINKRSFVNKYDILYGMIGTIGNPVIIQFEKQDYSVKNVGIFRFDGDEVKSKWFFYILQSEAIQNQINTILTGSSQKFLSLNVIRNFNIPPPPSPNKKR